MNLLSLNIVVGQASPDGLRGVEPLLQVGLDVLVIVVDQVLVGLVLVLVGVVLQGLGQELPTETLMCVGALSIAIKPLVLAVTLQWILLAVTLDRLCYGLYPERRKDQAVRSSAACSLSPYLTRGLMDLMLGALGLLSPVSGRLSTVAPSCCPSSVLSNTRLSWPPPPPPEACCCSCRAISSPPYRFILCSSSASSSYS